jgi:hypothetical protein
MASMLVFSGVQPQPRVLKHSESGDIQAALARFSLLFTPAHRLEAGGGRGRVFMFTYHRHREVIARGAGLDLLEHPMLGSC